MPFSRRLLLLSLLGPFLVTAAHAVTLDWDTNSWTAGSLGNSYDIDPSKARNDITLTISGNTGQLQPKNTAPNHQTPALTNTLQGGRGTAENTLCLALNLTSQNQFVTLSINFSALHTEGVTGVSFSLLGIDFANSDGSDTVADPTCQHIGIHDISFTPVPEINPVWSAFGSCLVAAALILRHSGKFRK